jgi:hypothetical protein
MRKKTKKDEIYTRHSTQQRREREAQQQQQQKSQRHNGHYVFPARCLITKMQSVSAQLSLSSSFFFFFKIVPLLLLSRCIISFMFCYRLNGTSQEGKKEEEEPYVLMMMRCIV